MPDEPIDTTQGESGTPAPGGEPSPGGSPSPESGTVTPLPGDSSAAGQAQPLENPIDQPVVDPIAEALKELPSTADLQAAAERGEKYAKTLAVFRPIVEGNQAQSKQFEPWKSVVEQYGEPARLQSQLEFATQCLKDKVIEGGRSVPDMQGAIKWLDDNSPARADAMMVDLLQSKVTYNDVEDTRLNHVSRQIFGKSVPEIQAALQELETRPASQVIDKAELEAIDPKFHEVWKGLAPETKEWLMDERTTETAKNQYLQKELESVQRATSDREKEETDQRARTENATKFYAEAKAEGEKAVDDGLGQILNSILDSTFKDISNDMVTMTGSKDTDVRLRGIVGATLITLTDPVKRPYVESMLGIQFDPEIDTQNALYEKATIAAKIATKYGDKASADARQLEADNASMWIKAKGNELSRQLTDYFSSIFGLTNTNRATLLGNANGGRRDVQGNPLNPAGGGGNGNQPQFSKPLGPERNAEIASRFER